MKTELYNAFSGNHPSTKFHKTQLSSFGDETCGRTEEYNLPIMCSFYTLHMKNT